MPVNPEEKQTLEQNKQERQQRNAAIGQLVMHTLGRPGDFLSVQVRRLWDNHYRVNVMTGPDAGSIRVTNSYFLVADDDGNIHLPVHGDRTDQVSLLDSRSGCCYSTGQTRRYLRGYP